MLPLSSEAVSKLVTLRRTCSIRYWRASYTRPVDQMTKRQRKRQNRIEKIERIQAAQKREARNRFLKRLGIFFALFALVLAVFWWQSKDDGESKADSSSSTSSSSSVPSTPPTAEEIAAAGVDEGDEYYLATIATPEGNMVAALNATKAPEGVKQFVTLAKAGFYDDLTFHRAAKGFVIQGGDPEGNGTGGVSGDKTGGAPKSGIGEAPPGNKYVFGDLAYAKGGRDPAFTFGSQFFVVVAEDGANAALAPSGQPQYGWFGRVVTGIDVATAISNKPVSNDGSETLNEKIKITKVTISELLTKGQEPASDSSSSSAGGDTSSSSETSSSSTEPSTGSSSSAG